MHQRLRSTIAGCLAAVALAGGAQAQGSAEDANKSNNPLNLAASFNIQNYYSPSLFGSNAHTNDLLLRPTLPLGPNKLIGVPQIIRGTVPVSSRPCGMPKSKAQQGLARISLRAELPDRI